MTAMLEKIDMPEKFVVLAKRWHSGDGDMLLAIASTGDLTLGTNRPYDYDENRYMTDQEWHRYIWSELCSDLRYAVRIAKSHYDLIDLKKFLTFAENTEARLVNVYGLPV